MRAARRNAQPPGHDIPSNGAHKCAEDHLRIDDIGSDDPGADGLGNVQAKEQKGDEIEERRPNDGIVGAQDPRRDDRRDRVGSVVQSIEKIESQRDRDETNNERKVDGAQWPAPQT
jgi:hypothetical protein